MTSEPININNYWRIGSITKTITAEAVLILADEGKIDVNKPISFYFPEYKIPGGDKISIRMLGNMTSGLYDYTTNMDWYTSYINSNHQKVFTPEELLAIVLNNPIQYEPGTRYYYNNSNYLLLGFLIKKVTGKEIIDVFNEKIFQPLGMNNTFWPNTRYLPYPYSHGYSLDNNSLTDVTNWDPSWGDAAGILISNISDLKIWAKELGECKLLSEKMKSERYAWVDSDAPGLKYSGFGLEKIMDWVGHPGAIFGYNSQLWYNPVKKITVIVTTNSMDGYPTEAVIGEIINILTPFK
jgi:D-alanyl-D-alanine carboxypeptidase